MMREGQGHYDSVTRAKEHKMRGEEKGLDLLATYGAK